MPDSSSELPSRQTMKSFLERAVPGVSPVVRRMREQLLDFACSLTGKAVLIRGPVGSGKSTAARIVGLLKRVAPLKVAEAGNILTSAKFDGHNRIDLRYMPWYVELTLTGLVETIAESQLFGSLPGAFTGAVNRAGVFEQAIRGHAIKGKEPASARLTGGVVFLDEIGDLTAQLQAKLLPVLGGAPFYRLGGEGNDDHEVQFHGVVVTASWRDIDAKILRADLLSRISAYRIDVPGIEERREDFELILDEVQRNVLLATKGAIARAEVNEPFLDHDYWAERQKHLGPVSTAIRRRLRRIDWSRHGNVRGLAAALEQIIAGGRDIEQIVDELPVITHADEHGSEARIGLLSQLLELATKDEGLLGNLRRLEVDHRAIIRESILGNELIRRRLADKLGTTEEHLIRQVYELDRRRRRLPRGDTP